ncbi:hypothetical protein HYH03_000147 [Edaphochlamys debaryana]|uniref:Uncharacterized protein n=1 Tax=Edaphochlamys debaryana TaxID=47281 RepID=A0A836C6X7_9CHLO|nr:hypothetical protein HYH03_000147 [Edaphochlamys debaryana]|eukprot:KAG2501643.1 hypothetical protein HYH03_000147 [Edaphochlamys debaryana]
MSFRFSLGRAQIKQFKTTLLTLNKIGGELLVEATPEQFTLRALNTAKSAILCVGFNTQFFDSYGVYDSSVVQTALLTKNVLAILRSQRIVQVDFSLDFAVARLSATVQTEEGLVKRYSCDCIEGESLHPSVDKDAFPTVVIAEAAELDKLLASFQNTMEEITVIANPISAAALAAGHKACELKSYTDPNRTGQDQTLQTSLTLDTRSVFTSYHHASDMAVDVTFNVRDFRTMCGLCAALEADVALRFELAGAPVLVEPHFRDVAEGSGVDFTGMLVLSSLAESVLGPEHQARVLEAQQAQHEAHHGGVDEAPNQQAEPRPADAAQSGWQEATTRDGGAAAAAGAGPGTVAGGGAGRGRGRRLQSMQGAPPPAGPAEAARGAYAAAAAAEGMAAGNGHGYAGEDAGMEEVAVAMEDDMDADPGAAAPRAAGGWAQGSNPHQQPPPHQQQQQQQFLQFPRAGPVSGGSGTREESAADSQDPEGLPGSRSPYSRQTGPGRAPAPGAAPGHGGPSAAQAAAAPWSGGLRSHETAVAGARAPPQHLQAPHLDSRGAGNSTYKGTGGGPSGASGGGTAGAADASSWGAVPAHGPGAGPGPAGMHATLQPGPGGSGAGGSGAGGSGAGGSRVAGGAAAAYGQVRSAAAGPPAEESANVTGSLADPRRNLSRDLRTAQQPSHDEPMPDAGGPAVQHQLPYGAAEADAAARPVSHAELFGEGDEGEDDDDEELPATPPEQLNAQSYGTGVLGKPLHRAPAPHVADTDTGGGGSVTDGAS